MKTLSISKSDAIGGAFRAAYRIHRSLLQCDIESQLAVDIKLTEDSTVYSRLGKLSAVRTKLRPVLGRLPRRLAGKSSEGMGSTNWIRSNWPEFINQSNCDLVHLHWINSEMMSLQDFKRIQKPVVQTLHDMWAFCGAEHYSTENRWEVGYNRKSKNPRDKGFDFNSWVWNAKKRNWREPWQLVVPSNWLSACVKRSALMSDWPVEVIPNPVDTSVWKPQNKTFARSLFNLPLDSKILLFGAFNGTRNYRKGADILLDSLSLLQGEVKDLHIVYFGQEEPEQKSDQIFPSTYVGKVLDDVSLVALYSAADVLVNPARQEAFGQTGSEAQACGLPVVAFADTGLADIVEHHTTGVLCQLGNVESFAEGIKYVLDHHVSGDLDETSKMSLDSVSRARRLFAYEVVGEQHKNLYQRII